MIQLTSQNGHTTYGLKEFVISTEDELNELPIENLITGSTAYVVDIKKTYMFVKDSDDLWVEL